MCVCVCLVKHLTKLLKLNNMGLEELELKLIPIVYVTQPNSEG